MNERNPIVYFEEDGNECLTNHGCCGKVLDIKPHVTDAGRLVQVEFVLENAPNYGTYFITYQKSFKIRLQDGRYFEFVGIHGDVADDLEFNKQFLEFVENFHNGKYEDNESKFQVTDEVEFMDI